MTQLTPEQKTRRTEQLKQEIASAVAELWNLVTPTAEEIDEVESTIWDTIGKLYLIDSALRQRSQQ